MMRIEDRIATIRRPERILVFHVAKTAGTSFRGMLELEYGARLVYPGIWHLNRLPKGWYPLGSEMLRNLPRLPPHNVLIGHFTAAMADMVGGRYRTATFLREPIQRSLSVLSHFSSNEGVPVQTLIDDPAFMAANVADYQTRILGADGVCDPHQVKIVDDATLARALQRLETLDFVGLTERFDESCRIFDGRFGTNVSRFIQRVNVRRPMGDELAEYIPHIEPIVQRDRVLYESLIARFAAIDSLSRS
jgi:hypothetical protein